MRGSADGIAANRPDHIQAEGGTSHEEGQQDGELQQTDQITYPLRVEQGHERVSRMELQQTDQITYSRRNFLRVEQGHKRVSRWNCSKQTRSHTP
jgi:hypothetical protein